MSKTYKPPVGRKIDVDCMPAEVAIEMLTNPKARITNRLRKECFKARSKFFVSEKNQKGLDEKLSEKLHEATWTQLSKWLVRSIRRRARVQKRYVKLPTQVEDENPLITRARAGLDLQAAQLDILRDHIETEIETRKEKTT